ncbi:MAG: radical SAM protein, partial [Myxococcales bacterium]
MPLPLVSRAPRPLNDLSWDELSGFLAPAAPTEEERRKVFAAIHAHGRDVAGLRDVRRVRRPVLDLAQTGEIARLEVVERRKALDGFVKYLFRSPRGGEFEAVRIPIFDEKHVVCISSQVGCALACDFCQTGRLGFKRNLATWEMVEQIRIIREEAELPVRGIVFMGMGEPLLNYDNVVRAAAIFSSPAGYSIGARTITVSTAGVVPAIHRYIREEQPYRLAFSVTSA